MTPQSDIRTIDEAMLALQGGVFALEHYGEDHPAVARAFQRACRLLDEAMHDDQIRIACAADHVIVRDKALPSSRSLCEGLFHRLAERGVTGLTISRGVTPDEFASIATWLAGPDRPWNPIPHVRPGAVAAAPDATRAAHGLAHGPSNGPGGAALGAIPLDPMRQMADVRTVWTRASAGEPTDPDQIESVVSAICTAVTGASGMMIPLACLRRHDEYTFVHTTNVAILAASLAEAVGLRDSQVFDLATAALLHDVGKRAIPKAVLNKSTPLSENELRIMRRHPVAGARLLYALERVPDVVPIVAFEHHIHLDGTGYPNVAPGWRISLASQIVQVADVYDALRTNRPYRAALSREESFDLMMRDAGTRFDTSLLEHFFQRVAMRTDRESLPELWTPTRKAA